MLKRICLITLAIFYANLNFANPNFFSPNFFSPNFAKVLNFGKVSRVDKVSRVEKVSRVGKVLDEVGLFSTSDTTRPLLKKWQVNTFAGAFYAGSLTGLSFLWYSDYSTGRFHFFNDMDEWKGMDKLGHMTSAFHLTRVQSDLYRNAGYTRGQAARISAICSFSYMSVIEILDGFSDGWGFSMGDMCANTLGVSLFALNEMTGKENLLSVKMGFHQTGYAQYNPSLLGENQLQQPLKDYKGQTYRQSMKIKEFQKK